MKRIRNHIPMVTGSGGGVVGGGDTTYNQYVSFFEHTGPSSYSTGGMVLDLTATYASLNAVKLLVKKGSRGSLPAGNLRYALNSPTAGKVTIVISQHQFEKATSIGNVANQPAGVTVQASSGVTTSSESSHTHDITHNHGSAASSAATNTGAAVNAALTALNQNVGSHTHAVDPPNLVATSGAGSSHNHVDNNIYAHTHTNSYTATNVSRIELANATNISTTTWLGFASGVRA